MKLQVRHDRSSGRIKAACAFVTLTGLLALPMESAWADSKDGNFPTADQVGGQVYIDPIGMGQKLPTDFEAYDLNGQRIDLGSVVQGKRSLVVFFISAVPVSVAELSAIEDFTQKYGKGVNLVMVNADTVGTALMGGPKAVIPNSVKTLHYIKKENRLKTTKIYLAPNDALSADAVSTRLGIRGLPTSFLLDEKGVVQKVWVGPQKWQIGDI